MKRTKISFVGEKPIFTGSPQIVPGGFNLDREKQRFSVGDIILPEHSLFSMKLQERYRL